MLGKLLHLVLLVDKRKLELLQIQLVLPTAITTKMQRNVTAIKDTLGTSLIKLA